VQVIVNAPIDAGATVARSVSSRYKLIGENERLKAQNLMLSTRAQRYSALERENERLRGLLDSSVVFDQQVIVADVLAIETSPSARQVVVDKGSSQGVFVGQALLDAYGVVGQVSHVGPFSATALLITDVRHALPVLINRNGLRAIAVGGERSNELNLSFISTNADIKLGDLVVTSGLGRRFPAGYPVGSIKDVSIEPGASFTTVVVEPSAKVGHSREVLLIGPRPPELEDERVSSVEPLERELISD
jgi:rod shape-determining protein MreC